PGRLAEELEGGHPPASAGVNLLDASGLHAQAKGLEEQDPGLREREEQLLARDDVDGALGDEGLRPQLGKGAAHQEEMESSGQVRQQPLQGARAQRALLEVMDLVQDENEAPLQRRLRI